MKRCINVHPTYITFITFKIIQTTFISPTSVRRLPDYENPSKNNFKLSRIELHVIASIFICSTKSLTIGTIMESLYLKFCKDAFENTRVEFYCLNNFVF